MVHKEAIHPVNSLHGSGGSKILLTRCMIPKEIIHPVNSLHGSQGSNTSSKLYAWFTSK